MEVLLKEFLFALSYVVVFMVIWKVGKFIIDNYREFKAKLRKSNWDKKKINI